MDTNVATRIKLLFVAGVRWLRRTALVKWNTSDGDQRHAYIAHLSQQTMQLSLVDDHSAQKRVAVVLLCDGKTSNQGAQRPARRPLMRMM